MMPMLLLWPPRDDRIASSSDVVAVHGRRLGGRGEWGGGGGKAYREVL
jgi:hypothetical protein